MVSSQTRDPGPVVSVAVLAPLRGAYDYLLPDAVEPGELVPGRRVRVPFGRTQRIGVVIARHATSELPLTRLKPIIDVLDDEPLIDASMLALAQWTSSYYHHPLGEVLAAMLPTWLRRETRLPAQRRECWSLTEAGLKQLNSPPSTALRQRAILDQLVDGACEANKFALLDFAWRPIIARLIAKGWVEICDRSEVEPRELPRASEVNLNTEQLAATVQIEASFDRYAVVVVDGVTGSGKTEVYFDAIARCLQRQRQALILVPEIALTEQLVQRFLRRFGSQVALLHSGRSARERALAWAECRNKTANVLIGTRSAVWAPLPALGLIVVDEEHDPSYKQQDGLRYSARDIAIVRAQRANCPIVLGSATPSLETLANVRRGRYQHAQLRQRAIARSMPAIHCIDVRGLTLKAGLSDRLISAMDEHLRRGEQIILFLNRRGYSPLLICRNCGEPRRCDRCDAFLVFHKTTASTRCHHCDRQWPLSYAPRCCQNPDVQLLGQGTERLEECVSDIFPDARICRIDRDAIRRKDALQGILTRIANREVDIVIGTQIVAKGLDFAGVTLVGIVDADSRLYSVDFRAEERLAQLLLQVAGRAGRAELPGRVLIQTHHPEHPVLGRIIAEGYGAYATVALREREEIGLPPYRAMALVRAESAKPARALAFLGKARRLLNSETSARLDLSYPIPAAMERRAGSYRALIVVTARGRRAIGDLFTTRLDALDKLAREELVRWSVDIDPQDTL